MAIAFTDTERFVEFLRNAGASEKRTLAGRSLLEHLVGTSQILQRWHCSDLLVTTGLFHDVYGCNTPGIVSEANCSALVEILGEEAGRYVRLFSDLDHMSLLRPVVEGQTYLVALRDGSATARISSEERRSLVTVFWASCCEEILNGRPTEARHDTERLFADAFAATAEVLPTEAKAEISHLVAATVNSHPGPVPGLSALLGEDRESAFIAEYWPCRAFVAHGTPERLREFLPSDVRGFLQLPCRQLIAFSPLTEGSEALAIDYAQALPLYRAGFTLCFHDIQSPAFEPWLASIGNRLGLCGDRTRISAFASRRGEELTTHYDANDIFVVQLKGTKRWRLATENNVPNPTVGYRVDKQMNSIQALQANGHQLRALSAEHTIMDLSAGSVAYIPRGQWRRCEATDSESLYVNIQTGLLTKGDLLVYLLVNKLLPAKPHLRERVRGAFSSGTLRVELWKDLHSELRKLADDIEEVDMAFPQDDFFNTSRLQNGVLMAGGAAAAPNPPVRQAAAKPKTMI